MYYVQNTDILIINTIIIKDKNWLGQGLFYVKNN